MKEQIEKILKFAELTLQKKDGVSNFEHVQKQVAVLLMNEVFGNSINEGMKVTLLSTVSSVLFDSGEKATFSKSEHDWGTFYSISIAQSKILFDADKKFVQITDAVSAKEQGEVILYKCSNDIMTRTTIIRKEREIIVYDDIGLQKNKVIRGVSVPGNVPYEEHVSRDDNDLTTVYINEVLDNGESFSTSVKKTSKIYELDTSVNDVYHGSEDDLEGINTSAKENLEKEEIYKYFPGLKEKILNRLSSQFTIVTDGNKAI